MPHDTIRPETAWDERGALARLGGDRDLLADMIGFFLEDAPPLEAQLHAAVQANDAPKLRATAHALKGLVAGCGGVRAAQAAQRIEHAGQTDDLGGVAPLIDALGEELDALRAAIRRHHS